MLIYVNDRILIHHEPNLVTEDLKLQHKLKGIHAENLINIWEQILVNTNSATAAGTGVCIQTTMSNNPVI